MLRVGSIFPLAEFADHRFPPRSQFFFGAHPRLLMQPHHHALVGHHGHAFIGGQFIRAQRKQFFAEFTRGLAARAQPRQIGWRKNSSAMSGRDQNRFLFFGNSAWKPAAKQTASENNALTTPSGSNRWNGTDSTSNGSVMST